MKQLLKTLVLIPVFYFFINKLTAQVKKVEAIGITVSDMSRSVKFYTEVLGFKKISEEELTGEKFETLKGIFGLRIHVVRMRLGDEQIELTDFLTSGGRNIGQDAKPNDLSFQHIAIVVSDMDKAYARLRLFNVEHVSTSPQTLPASIAPAAGIKAFYFHDPDGHNLELIWFPRDKGQKKWHMADNKAIFLGIDHTAIGISNTEKSLEFYQQLLGFERKGESFNQGTEQEHLNNVEGASLHITALRSQDGPGIEFLQYLQPGPGKPYPSDTRANDIWYWQTVIIVNDAGSLYRKLQQAGYLFVSKGLVDLKVKGKRATSAFIVKDLDGHAILVREE